MTIIKDFPISKEEILKRTLESLEKSKVLELEERGRKSLVMLLEHPDPRAGHFAARFTFFRPGEEKYAKHFFEDEGSG